VKAEISDALRLYLDAADWLKRTTERYRETMGIHGEAVNVNADAEDVLVRAAFGSEPDTRIERRVFQHPTDANLVVEVYPTGSVRTLKVER
jgi:hypothetical protein